MMIKYKKNLKQYFRKLKINIKVFGKLYVVFRVTVTVYNYMSKYVNVP